MVLNILLVGVALYFMLTFLVMGIFMYRLLAEFFPDADPFLKFNTFVFYWILADLLLRFFFQKLPVMSVKPLLTLPVKRKTVVHFVLGKSVLSFFNFLPLFIVIPFGVMLFKNGYAADQILVWGTTLFLVSLCVNFVNFHIESITAETEWSFSPIIALTIGLFAINYFEIVSFSGLVSGAILAISTNLIGLFLLALVLFVLYTLNFKKLYQKLYLDNSLKSKSKSAKTTSMQWTKRFGDIAPFLELDLKLISRNKRPRSSVFILIIGLLYGLFFYPNPGLGNIESFYIFVGIFVTGIFLINFGQFIPAWDSGYYKLLMSQNIKYERYLKSKFLLMVFSVIVMFVLTIPYVYFGWKVLAAHFVAAIFNIGINSHIILFAGAFNRKKIDLNQRAAFNYQGTGAVQWLVGIPLLLLPMGLFYVVAKTLNFEAALFVLAGIGIIGIVWHQKMMKHILFKYTDAKYKMINAFSQD